MDLLQKIGPKVKAVILEVGAFIRAEKGKVVAGQIEKKYLNNLVSYVDKESEKRLIDGFQQLLPDSNFLAEEETVAADQQDSDWLWIIDPLDGTTNFLHQIPFFAISVALQYKGKTVLGMVYEVCGDELFFAWDGMEKVYANQQPIQVCNTEKLEDALLATGFPYYDFEHVESYIQLLKYFMRSTRGLRRCGAAALDLAYVAAGRYAGFFEHSLSAWDVAAGAYLVQRAGGKVCDFSGADDYIYGREIIASNTPLFETLLLKCKAAFKESNHLI